MRASGGDDRRSLVAPYVGPTGRLAHLLAIAIFCLHTRCAAASVVGYGEFLSNGEFSRW